jgi:hypothetical protein
VICCVPCSASGVGADELSVDDLRGWVHLHVLEIFPSAEQDTFGWYVWMGQRDIWLSEIATPLLGFPGWLDAFSNAGDLLPGLLHHFWDFLSG